MGEGDFASLGQRCRPLPPTLMRPLDVYSSAHSCRSCKSSRLVQCITNIHSLYGCTCAQTLYYYYHYHNDRFFMKALVSVQEHCTSCPLILTNVNRFALSGTLLSEMSLQYIFAEHIIGYLIQQRLLQKCRYVKQYLSSTWAHFILAAIAVLPS